MGPPQQFMYRTAAHPWSPPTAMRRIGPVTAVTEVGTDRDVADVDISQQTAHRNRRCAIADRAVTQLPAVSRTPAGGTCVGDRAGVVSAGRDLGDGLSRERPAHLDGEHAVGEDAVAELALRPSPPAVDLALGDRTGEEVAEADLRDGEVVEYAADARRRAA